MNITGQDHDVVGWTLVIYDQVAKAMMPRGVQTVVGCNFRWNSIGYWV
jgi:hypothetical protein